MVGAIWFGGLFINQPYLDANVNDNGWQSPLIIE